MNIYNKIVSKLEIGKILANLSEYGIAPIRIYRGRWLADRFCFLTEELALALMMPYNRAVRRSIAKG